MAKKLLTAFFALLAIAVGGLGCWLALSNMDSAPVLLEAPEAAQKQVLYAMDALCENDYAAVAAVLYGQPELGMDRETQDPVGLMFHDAYKGSLTYELMRDCYATDSGVAMDVRVTALDIHSTTASLREISQQLLEQRVAEAEDTSAVYDENGEYREDVVMEVLYSAAQQVLEAAAQTKETELTLECVYQDGQWWIVPNAVLLEIIGGGIGE